MAGFTDAIPSFNPYIQQLPIESMVAVGMEKQQRYDQGVQRIQSQIDQVAGLAISRPQDRQYLQSKLNDLGSKLKTVAAGDFSNYQLVNSVAGMASSVAKDVNVLSSVQASAQYVKEQKFMEESRQKGDSAIQNEYDFNQQSNSWFNDPNVGAGFNGRYKKYIDVDKKFLDIMKTLHSDLLEEDIPYTTNPDGSINIGETAAAMQRISKESVSANKIENALRASLSPDEIEQLNINGRYQFRGIQDAEQLSIYATTKTSSSIAQNNLRIEELKGALKLYASDTEKTLLVEEGIRSLEGMNQRLSQQMNEEIEFIKRNPEEAKGMIYKNGAIEQFANAHAWETQKNNLLTNPVAENEWKAKNYGLSQKNYMLNVEKFSWQQQKDLQDYKLKLQEAQAKMFGIQGAFTVYGGQNTNVTNQKVALAKDIKDTSLMVEDQVNLLINELNAKGGTKVQKIQVLNALDAYLKGDVGTFNSLIPNDLKELGDSIISAKVDLNRDERFLKNIEDETKQSLENKDIESQYFAKINDIGPLSVKIEGQKVQFSPQEIAQYLSKVDEVEVISNVGSPLTESRSIQSTISGNLTEKEKLIYNNRGALRGYLSNYKQAGLDYNKEYNNLIEKKISEKTAQYIPREVPIIFGSGEGNIARSTWENISTSLLRKVADSSLSGMEGGYPELSSSEASNALSWFNESDKSNLQYKKLEQGDKTSLIILKGNEEVIIPLTPSEAQQLPIIDKDSPSPQLRKLMEAQAMGARNTNPSGSFENSYFQNQFMPKVKMNVRADMTQSFGNSQKQFITFRLKIPNGMVYPLQYPQPVDATEGMNLIANLTDEKVKQLYLQSLNISEEIKKIIRNL